MSSSPLPAFCKPTRNGIALFVRLTPKSSKDAMEGAEETGDGKVHLKARVRAVPEDGKANAALEKLVADWLKVPRKSVTVAAGTTSRLKTVEVEGDGTELLAQVAKLADQLTTK